MFANESSSFLNSLAVNEREEREKRQRRSSRGEKALKGILADSIQRKRANTAPSRVTDEIGGSRIPYNSALQTSLTASQPISRVLSDSSFSTTSSGERNGYDDNVFNKKKNKER